MYIEFTLQTAENYGSAEAPHWKQKGAVYTLLPLVDAQLYAAENREAYLSSLVVAATEQLEINNEYYRQNVVDWCLVPSDHYTEHELAELAYEGQIRDWAEVIELPQNTKV